MTDNQDEVKQVSTALYEECLPFGVEKLWWQEDLLELGVVPGNDVHLLGNCINRLLGERLMRNFTKDGRTCFKVVSREDAAKYQNLTQDEVVVYGQIESAGRDGIWVKNIRTKTNLHQGPLNKSIKSLEHKGLIKQIHGHRAAASRRIYMLADLQPPEEISGGPFYSDGNLDEAFLRAAYHLLEGEIRERSWQRAKRRHVSFAEEDGERRKDRGARASSTREIAPAPKWLPMPPGYLGYPTLSQLTQIFNEWKLSPLKLKEDEISQLLDVLRWDGKIEKVRGGEAYKSVHPEMASAHRETDSGLSAAPCGGCPVADLCDDEGPVNAKSCKYFEVWLGED